MAHNLTQTKGTNEVTPESLDAVDATPRPRTIAVGDIHGHMAALDAILTAVEPQPEDTLIFLGDYVDHGPDSRGVLARLIALREQCQIVALEGNHDNLMRSVLEGRNDLVAWMHPQWGGGATLDSYETIDLSEIPDEHVAFLKGLVPFHETDTHLFFHANYAPNRRPQDQDFYTRTFLPVDQTHVPGPHYSARTVVVGHTPQEYGRVLDLGHLICIDTGCGYGGYLTALDVGTGRIWQVSEQGN